MKKILSLLESLGNAENQEIITIVGAGGKSTCIDYLAQEYQKQGKKVLVTTTTHICRPLDDTVWSSSPAVLLEMLGKTGYAIAGVPCEEEKEKMCGLPQEELLKAIKGADVVLIEGDGAKHHPFKAPEGNEPVIISQTTQILVVAGLRALGQPLEIGTHRLKRVCEILGTDKAHVLEAKDMAKVLQKGYIIPLQEQYHLPITILLNQADGEKEREEAEKVVIELGETPCVIGCLKGEKKVSIHLILLAAGFSKRFKENKLLYPIQGKPMVAYVLERLIQIQKERTDIASFIVVTQYEEIAALLQGETVKVVYNEHSEQGIASSMQLGIEQAEPVEGENAYCFIVGDQPNLRKETIEGMLDGFLKSKKGIGCVSTAKKTGNPVIFKSSYLSALRELTGDRGGKRILTQNLKDVFFYEVQEAKELEDWDCKKEDTFV